MTFEDKQKAKVIIYKLFQCDMTDSSLWEKAQTIGELSLLDLNEDEYDDIVNYLHIMKGKFDNMYELCKVGLAKSVIASG